MASPFFSRSTGPLALVAVGAIVLGAVLLSRGRKREPDAAGGAVLSPSAHDLAPGASPGERAIVRLGEKMVTEFEVALKTEANGPALSIELSTGGETFEREAYESASDAFRVLSAGTDAFVPGIDLLRYPVRDGAAWEWDGKVAYAGVSRDAHARVTTTKDGEAIRSEVRLSIQADPGRPELERRLTFWFERGRGVVRRAFGDVSSRRPVGEAWRP